MESFKCIKVLGRGTFGSVHLVYRKDDKKQKRMAMKTIKKEPIEIIFSELRSVPIKMVESSVIEIRLLNSEKFQNSHF